jgi:hypothetical protein
MIVKLTTLNLYVWVQRACAPTPSTSVDPVDCLGASVGRMDSSNGGQ